MSLRYVIDGYNVTNHPGFGKLIPKKQIDSRLSLINLIKTARLCGSPNNKACIVFDGYPDISLGALDEENIRVIFSMTVSADELIKGLLEQACGPRNIIVVSDDKEIIFFARSCSAQAMSVNDFLGSKNNLSKSKAKDPDVKISYQQMQKVNEELRKLWLS